LTGCGCFGVVAVIVALLYFMIRGSTDAGEPIDQG
jgi:hypothetical protein